MDANCAATQPGEIGTKAMHTIETVQVGLEGESSKNPLMKVLKVNRKRNGDEDVEDQR